MVVSRREVGGRTARALADDLRQIREEGGATQASDAAFAATITWPLERDEGFSERETAQAFVLTQLRRVLEEVHADKRTDVCDRAAAATLQTIFLRAPDDRELIATARRRMRERFDCHLTLDGLRKREDKLLRRIAQAMHGELVRRDDERGPRTIEERVRLGHDGMLRAYGVITDGLRRLYRHSPASDAPDRDLIVLNLLYHVAWTQWWAAPVLAIQTSGEPITPGEVLYADVAGRLAVSPFGFHDDKLAVRRILVAGEPADREAFKLRLTADAVGAGIIERFTQWATECHDSCAFMRSWNTSLLCDPHDFAWGLWLMLVEWDTLVSGPFDDVASLQLGVFPELKA
ncbi:MAG TPA: hypothetical protein VHO01_07920 [Jatrophihabitans sp.]|nr:hypothetical protein [Jatrophihabitans sp.]